jgi:hypothetical protein
LNYDEIGKPDATVVVENLDSLLGKKKISSNEAQLLKKVLRDPDFLFLLDVQTRLIS